MLTSSDPPIDMNKTPVTAYMDDSVLQKHVIAFNADKIKKVVGYELRHPKMTQEELGVVVDRWKEEGSWPSVKPKDSAAEEKEDA